MTIASPGGLAAKAYLIAYDVEKKKLAGGSNHGRMVRAAALVELWLGGQLVDEANRVRATGQRTSDPVLDAVLAQISESKPRRWKYWVNKNHKATYQAVRERLATEQVIKVEDVKILRLIPKKNVTVRDTRAVRELIAGTRAAVLGGTPVANVDAEFAVLAALVAATELNTVFSGRERRQHREKIAKLAERAGPAAPALRRAVQDQQATDSSAGA